MTYSWEWADAEREYKRAIELNPNLALAHRWYATYLRLMGRHEQAISEITRARELDPLSPGVNATVGYVLTSARRYDQAILSPEQDDRAGSGLSLHSSVFRHTYAAQGKYAEAVAAYTRASRSRSRYACHTGLSGCGGRARGRPPASAGGPSAPAIGQGARVSSRTGDSADRARRARAGVRVARRRVSSAGYPAAIPWRRAWVRSAALGPAAFRIWCDGSGSPVDASADVSMSHSARLRRIFPLVIRDSCALLRHAAGVHGDGRERFRATRRSQWRRSAGPSVTVRAGMPSRCPVSATFDRIDPK